MKKGDKKGQFYLIAAVIIIGVLIGIAFTTNYIVNRPTNTRVLDLTRELNLEGEWVTNFAISDGTRSFEEYMESFVEEYGQYLQADSDIYFIYGDGLNIKYIAYSTQSSGGIRLGGSTEFQTFSSTSQTDTLQPDESGIIVIQVSGVNYEYNIYDGKQFYAVIMPKTEGINLSPGEF